MIIGLVLLALAVSSCKKTRYCRCTATVNGEIVELNENVPGEYYIIEDNSSCSDRAREIGGWGQVICTEVSKKEATGDESSWWENLFNKN